jgi:hypothetical protein
LHNSSARARVKEHLALHPSDLFEEPLNFEFKFSSVVSPDLYKEIEKISRNSQSDSIV